MCFEEFTTSPYEMLVLVKEFFQDINQLLQNQETFEKDCSQVYRRTCSGPRETGSSPGETPRLCLCPANPCRAGSLGSPAWSSLTAVRARRWAPAGAVGTARVCVGPRLCRSAGGRPHGVAVSASSASVSSWGWEKGLAALWRWDLG